MKKVKEDRVWKTVQGKVNKENEVLKTDAEIRQLKDYLSQKNLQN